MSPRLGRLLRGARLRVRPPEHQDGLRESDLRPFADWTAEGINKHRNTRATQCALQLADEVLNYRGINGFTFQRTLEHMLARLDAFTTRQRNPPMTLPRFPELPETLQCENPSLRNTEESRPSSAGRGGQHHQCPP
jgi:hypothetical protein